MKNKNTAAPHRVLCAMLLILSVGLSGCSNKEKKPGQALASVNGEEITVLQLNDELQHANIQAAQQDAARKQLLESLIDRQLLQNEAVKEKVDRDPKVVQAIERAKALIVAQAYIQKRIGNIAKPSAEEVAAYYNEHPELFSQRKQFDMREVVLLSSDLKDNVKAFIDTAKSLDDVTAWLDSQKIKFARAQMARSSTDLPPELSKKLLGMPKGQLFIVREGDRSLIVAIQDIHDAPLSQEVASPQIAQFLYNKRNKEAADGEVARLRSAAKIEYLNGASAPAAPAAAAAAAAPAPAPAAAASAAGSNAANDRGVAGLR